MRRLLVLLPLLFPLARLGVAQVAEEAERTVVLYNNCYGNYGTTNARETVARLASDRDA